MGISNSYVTKIESGVRRYDQQLLEAAAKVLKCHAADLIVRDPTDPDGIWTIWDQLGAQERRQLVEIAKTFLAAKERA